jgi:hypothetical protein
MLQARLVRPVMSYPLTAAEAAASSAKRERSEDDARRSGVVPRCSKRIIDHLVHHDHGGCQVRSYSCWSKSPEFWRNGRR